MRKTSDVLAFVVVQQIEAGAAEMDVVPGDLVPQEAPGGRVLGPGHQETPCKIAQPRRNDERHVVLALPPRDAADLVVGDEGAVRPDAVFIESALDVA